MQKMVFLLKSYFEDYKYAERLINSFHRFNLENLKCYVVFPKEDFNLFKNLSHQNIILKFEEEVCPYLVKHEVSGIRPGYINQEIIKISFWENNFSENYMCLDSDGVFLRPFGVKDFMYDESVPYTILVEDNELVVEPEYYNNHWRGRIENIKKIKEAIDFNDDVLLTCHGFAILNSEVLKSLKNNFMKVKNLSYADLLEISPYEFSWYNLWLQKVKTIPIHVREPLFKTFHHKNQHIEYILRGISFEDMARGYLGVVVNSNYSRFMGVITFGNNRYEILSRYLSLIEIVKLLFYKIRNKIYNIFKKFKRI